MRKLKIENYSADNYRKVKDFFTNVETACHKEGVTSSKEMCKAVVRYSSQEVVSVIKGLVSFKNHDYTALKTELIFMYDGDRTEVEYGVSDIRHLAKRWNKVKIQDLSTYKEYYKEFQKIVGWLYVRGKVSEEEFKLWFWAGLPERFRRKVEVQLRIGDPNLDVTTPFDLEKITEVVKTMYTRDRFEHRIPLLIKGHRHHKKKEVNSEESESEEELENETSEEESEEERATIAEKVKEVTRSKKPTRVKDEKREKVTPKPVETPRENTSIDGLINQMRSLNLNDPRARAFWAEVGRTNPELKYKIRELSTFTLGAEPMNARGNTSYMGRDTRYYSNNGTDVREDKRLCYGCGKVGHTMGRCEKVQGLVNEKVIQRGTSGRWTWMDGSPIQRTEGEPLVDAVNKGIKHAALVMLTAGDEKGGKGRKNRRNEHEEGKRFPKMAYLSWPSAGDSDDESSDDERWNEELMTKERSGSIEDRENGIAS